MKPSYTNQIKDLDYKFNFHTYVQFEKPLSSKTLRITSDEDVKALMEEAKKQFKLNCPDLKLSSGYFKKRSDWDRNYVYSDTDFKPTRRYETWHAWVPGKSVFFSEEGRPLEIFSVQCHAEWDGNKSHNFYYPQVKIVGDVVPVENDHYIACQFKVYALQSLDEIGPIMKELASSWDKYKRATEYVESMKKQMHQKIKFMLSSRDL